MRFSRPPDRVPYLGPLAGAQIFEELCLQADCSRRFFEKIRFDASISAGSVDAKQARRVAHLMPEQADAKFFKTTVLGASEWPN